MSAQGLLRAFRWCSWFWLTAASVVIAAVILSGHDGSPAWLLCLAPWALCEAFIAYLKGQG